MQARRWVGLLFVVWLGIGGCGGGDDSSDVTATTVRGTATTTATSPSGTTPVAEGTLPDPCSLLTPEELTTQLGVDYGPGQLSGPLDQGGAPQCIWNPTVFPSSGHSSFILVVSALNEGLWDFGKDMADAVPVPDLGDDAYFNPLLRDELQVRIGDLEFDLYSIPHEMAQDAYDAAMIELAKLALTRLPTSDQ